MISEVLNADGSGATGSGDTWPGSWGVVKRGESVPASMKDLIYIHRRKTRKTVYQKSYSAGSSRRTNMREREKEREKRRTREGTEERGLHDGRNEIVRAWITADFVMPSH